MNQRRQILAHLKKHGTITSKQGSSLYGIDRTAARIFDLKEMGHEIQTVMIAVRGRCGKAHVARYSL
jgi:hypothetical protein